MQICRENFFFTGGVPPSDHQNLENIHNIDPICVIFQVFQEFFFFCRKYLSGQGGEGSGPRLRKFLTVLCISNEPFPKENIFVILVLSYRKV